MTGNVIKLVLGDTNAKCGRKTHFMLMIERESLHETSNGNGLRLISFAAAKYIIVSNTTFPHKTELIKYGGKEIHFFMFRLCQKIWNNEHLPIQLAIYVYIEMYNHTNT